MKTTHIPVQVPDWAKCLQKSGTTLMPYQEEWLKRLSEGDVKLIVPWRCNPNWRETLREVE